MVEPCICVYPDKCFCSPEGKALRDPELDRPSRYSYLNPMEDEMPQTEPTAADRYMEHEDPALRCAYWKGWLAAHIKEAIRRCDESRDGEHLWQRQDISTWLRGALEAYCQAPGNEPQRHMLDDLPAGFAVIAANGEPQAVRDTFEEAQAALVDTENYWYEASVCGHPDAPGYVRKLEPFAIRQVNRAERDELAEYPPVIDREG